MNLNLIPVTEENRAAAQQLEVFPGQASFIETVAQCMEEADQLPAWRPVCIMDGQTMVGFSMYGYIEEPKYNRVWFDRLLIDRHYQHRGYGIHAIHLILSRIRLEFPGQDIYLSVYDSNAPALSLYRLYGFHFTGELDTKGERIMVLRNIRQLPVLG